MNDDVFSKLEAIHNDIKGLSEIKEEIKVIHVRLTPLEDDLKFRSKLLRVILGSGGAMTLIGLALTILKLAH